MKPRDILELYREELELVEEEMKRSLDSVVPVINEVGMHIIEGGGKRLRPLLVILSARISGYNKKRDEIMLASIIETIHTASLLHDDVVDRAELRRGRVSANTLWGDQIVILVGDFLYSNALKLATTLNDINIIKTLSMAISGMTKSELFQLQKAKDLNITEDEYLKIIEGKTALLMATACSVGAAVGNAPGPKRRALTNYGLKLGLTFQLVDDILDYSADEKRLGKAIGNDLREGKITYPIICLLKDASNRDRERIKEIIISEDIT
ncbi:MAG: polyprenyl synthetase family protein, partial [Nitrospirae bacterium]